MRPHSPDPHGCVTLQGVNSCFLLVFACCLAGRAAPACSLGKPFQINICGTLMIFISWQQPIGVLPDTIADMAQPATGQANTAMESAEAGGGDADSYEIPIWSYTYRSPHRNPVQASARQVLCTDGMGPLKFLTYYVRHLKYMKAKNYW